MRFNVTGGHVFGVHGQNLLLDVLADAGLIFPQHLGVKFALAIPRHRYLYIAKTGAQGFAAAPVPAVIRVLVLVVIPAVAQLIVQLGLQTVFHELGVRFKSSLPHSLDCGNLSGTPSGNNPLVVVRQRYRLASGVLALCLGNGDTLALALEDVLAFEFCDRRKRHSRRHCRNKHNDTIADNNRFS